MKREAIAAAREAFERAKVAAEALSHGEDIANLERAWSDFLTMANRVYVKLEQGAKSNGPSYGWFGEKKHERRKDPLLSYIKNARDADEHGLELVTKRHGTKITIGAAPGKTVRINEPIQISASDQGGQVEFGPSGAPSGLVVNNTASAVRLVEVTNRGTRYQPPGDTDPASVAKKAISYLQILLEEAETL